MWNGKFAKKLNEYDESVILMKWVRAHQKTYPELNLFYHIPNGEKRSIITAVKLKKMGVLPGIPDYHLPVARRGFHSLYIELKSETGRVSDTQQKLHLELVRRNNVVVIAFGAQDAIHYLEKYITEVE
jgi:VRR-NUC domain